MVDINTASSDRGVNSSCPVAYTLTPRSNGYVIRGALPLPYGVVVGQVLSYMFGVVFAVATLGILLLPVLFFAGELTAMRWGSAGLFGALAAYLLWFASRGTRAEVEVDLDAGLIREVVPHRGGAPTVVSSLTISGLGGVFREEADAAGQYDLVLRSPLADQSLWVARGAVGQLAPLEARLCADLGLKS